MQTSFLRLGNFGPLNIQLHYTWLLAFVLGLWWLALLQLPDNYPGWPGAFYWLVALAALLFFLFSVIAHELVHTFVARSGKRTVLLFPFGAAQPFRLRETDPGRAVLSAIAGPLFNLALGGLLLIAAAIINDTAGALGAIKAFAWALGTLNVAFGIGNLIPGVPFDGGWLLVAGINWFGTDSETALRVGRSAGRVAALVLVLMGAWLGLATDQWIVALLLVLPGWAAHEAGALGQQRSTLLGAFNQLTAVDLMEHTRAGDAVRATDSVADLVQAHLRYDPDIPLPVLDEAETLVGIVTTGAAEQLLQGTWPTTLVTALMTQLDDANLVDPGAGLTEVLNHMEAYRGTAPDEQHIPVVKDGVLVGSINPNRLLPFIQLEEEFGINNTERAGAHRSFLGRLGAVLPVAIVIAIMAVLGNIALRTDPAELRDLASDETEANITFSNQQPADDAFLGLGGAAISVDLQSTRPISDVIILLDGSPLETDLSGSEPVTRTTATAQVPSLLLGPHNITVLASTTSDRSKSVSWSFRVTSSGQAEEEDEPAGGNASGPPS